MEATPLPLNPHALPRDPAGPVLPAQAPSGALAMGSGAAATRIASAGAPGPGGPAAPASYPERGARTRARILDLIVQEPGVHTRAIARMAGVSRGTTSYHLHVLEGRGEVVAGRNGRYRRYFAGRDARAFNRDAIHVLRHPMARAIAEAVAGQPGIIQKDLCAALGITASRASWHLRRLADAGVVGAQRRGQRVHYTPASGWRDAAGKLPPRRR